MPVSLSAETYDFLYGLVAVEECEEKFAAAMNEARAEGTDGHSREFVDGIEMAKSKYLSTMRKNLSPDLAERVRSARQARKIKKNSTATQ